MRICNFSSGSDGNCTYVETDNTKILIDAGISAALITKNLHEIGVNPFDIDGIFVSHEHFDHIKGIDVFSAKYNTKVFAHANCWQALEDKLKKVTSQNRHYFFDNYVELKNFNVFSCPVSHDAKYTVGYKVSDGKNQFAIITDLGIVTPDIIEFSKSCPLVYIEANHDVPTLQKNQNYSFYLKSRILSNHGHLSNNQSAQAIEQMAINGTRQFVLSHLSKENNTPEMAYNTICKYLQTKDIIEGTHIRIAVADITRGPIFRLE